LTKLVGDFIHSIDGIETPIPGLGIIPYLLIDHEQRERGEGGRAARNPSLTLIDTCYISELPKIESYLKNLDPGYDLRSIKRIILTHLHNDHVQATNEIKRRSGAKVYAHWIEAPYLAKELIYQGQPKEDVFSYFYHQFHCEIYGRFRPFERDGINVDVQVKDGDIIGEDTSLPLEVIHTPGHTPGSIALYSKKFKTVIGGDCLIKSVLGVSGLSTPLPFNSIDAMTAAISALRISYDLDFDKLFLGHQDSPILEGARQAVKQVALKAIDYYNETNRFLPRSG
jgi:glyoxylase-like metal-dependent hydrolase (beta-lactamase superfamily II)